MLMPGAELKLDVRLKTCALLMIVKRLKPCMEPGTHASLEPGKELRLDVKLEARAMLILVVIGPEPGAKPGTNVNFEARHRAGA